ncbi:MAG: LEPR-XLL domain-containing protein, partial [Pirellulales bacterium]|nr:LEPR-XLL domain-containing protein [Pirellulales bacterium]
MMIAETKTLSGCIHLETLEPRLLLDATVGGGTVDAPALGAGASYGLGDDMILVKNWDFGTDGDSTITSQSVMNEHFQ